jgi:catechol-2,3-dioxygenase
VTDFLSLAPASMEAQRVKAVEHAKLYHATFSSPTGKKLLEDWTHAFMEKRVPVNAPHTEYAAVEAVRAFIAGIHQQIKLAETEGR